MDQSLIASFRHNLEAKSQDELNQVVAAAKTPEEVEAARQILDERRRNGQRFRIALATAVVIGTLAAVLTWWHYENGAVGFITGIVCAVLGFASWYIPGLIPFVRP